MAEAQPQTPPERRRQRSHGRLATSLASSSSSLSQPGPPVLVKIHHPAGFSGGKGCIIDGIGTDGSDIRGNETCDADGALVFSSLPPLSSMLYTTNPIAFPIPGLDLFNNFLSDEEATRILRLLDDEIEDGCNDMESLSNASGGWAATGFTSATRRRVQLDIRESTRGYESVVASNMNVGDLGCMGGQNAEAQGAMGGRKSKEDCSNGAEALRPLSLFERRWGWLLQKILSLENHHGCEYESYSHVPFWASRRSPSSQRSESGNDKFTNTKQWLVYLRHHSRIEILAEEYRGASPSAANLFEDNNPSSLNIVAELSLCEHGLLSFKKPKERSNETWELHENGDTKVLVPCNSLLMRSGECLEQWRSNVSCRHQHAFRDGGGGSQGIDLPPGFHPRKLIRHNGYRRISLKVRFFRDQPRENETRLGTKTLHSGVATSPEACMWHETTPMPRKSLWELLTIVVTTSPVKSHPSTELLEKTFDTFRFAGEDFAYRCPKVIVCDGLRLLDESDEGENAKQNGCAEQEACDRDRGELGEEKKSEREVTTGDCGELGEEKKSDREVTTGDRVSTASDNVEFKRKQQRPRHRKVSRKHTSVKQALRNGIATLAQAQNYRVFKMALRQLCEGANLECTNPVDGEDGGDRCCDDDGEEPVLLSPFRNTKVVELSERHGYGFALREALRHHVHTPYVCVVQHDRTFMRPTPVEETVRAMFNSSLTSGGRMIKYVGMSMRSNLLYRDVFISKYGKIANEQLGKMVLRPPELRLSSDVYGPEGRCAKEMISSIPHGPLRRNLLSLRSTYFTSETFKCHRKWMEESDIVDSEKCKSGGGGGSSGLTQLSLTPTIFWYDNTHIVETSHYRDFVFHPKYRMVARGGFVEDKLSPVLIKQVERLGLVEAHSNFGCYLLDDHSGTFFTGHLDGGSYFTDEERKKLGKSYRQCELLNTDRMKMTTI